MNNFGLHHRARDLTGPNTLPSIMVRLSQSASLVRFLFRQASWMAHLNKQGAWRACLGGFSPAAYSVYGLDRNDPALYLSDYARSVPSARINGQYNSIINNKLAAWTLLAGSSVPVPLLLAVIEKGRIRPYPPCSRSVQVSLADLLTQYRRLVLKPVRGLKGIGLLFAERTESGTTLNGHPLTEDALRRTIETLDAFIVTEFIEQAPYALRLYPQTTNTLRLLTLWDSTINRPFIAAAAQRIGTSRSFPVDNWKGGRGGLSASVNLATGELGRASSIGADGRVVRCDTHPETGARITGEVVTGWPAVTEGVLSGAARLFFAPFIGWDVVVCPDGFSVLEINGSPGVRALQVHEPLLADPRVRRFFAEHGVIRG